MEKGFKELADKMRDEFANAKKRINEKSLPIPEGEYMARIQSCAIVKSKSSDNFYIQIVYYIIEGEEKGRTEYDNSMVIIPEKAERIIKFFQRFELDTDLIIDGDTPEVINQYCDIIHQASPIVRINARHWDRTDGSVGVNLFLNKVVEGLEAPKTDNTEPVDNQESEKITETVIEDGLEEVTDKPSLKTIIFDENLDISPVQIVKLSVDELREKIRECRKNESSPISSEEEELRQRLIQLCQSQGIDEVNSESTIDEIKTIIDEDVNSGYQFSSDGDNALTNEEINTLIDASLDQKITGESKPVKSKTVYKPQKLQIPVKKKGNRK